MKHLILLLFALLLLGCKDNGGSSIEIVDKEVVELIELGQHKGFWLYKVTYQNHDYICSYKGGIIHSQSCRCLNP